MTRVLQCMVCGRPYSRDPNIKHLTEDELAALLETERGETGHISHGICPDCVGKPITPETRAKVVNEVVR